MATSLKKILIEEPVSQVEFELEVLGCFSMPESWRPTETETNEYIYNVSFLGTQVNNGKIRKRELTEEEIKAGEEAKKGKKEVPKKKGLEAEIEANEEKKKADELTRRGSQSSRYDDEAMFYANKEDLFKHPCITWENDSASDLRLVKSYAVTQQIEEMKMLELLECLEETGTFLEFSRVPKTIEEEAKKKPVKGKPQEEAKSSFYKAWVNLASFSEFGITEQQIRVKLEDHEGDEVTNAKTYIALRIKFSSPLFPPRLPNLTTMEDLIPTKPPPPKFLPSKDGTHDFQRQIKLACKAIAAEYDNSYSEQLNDNSASLNKAKELRDLRRDEFLYNFNTSGKSQILKNKLRKSVVKICRERYKSVNTLKGLNFNEKDKIYSELYAYLLGKMQESLQELTQEKREILHEECLVPEALAESEKQEKVSQMLNESYDQKLKRLAFECEIINDIVGATKYLRERTVISPLEKEVWLDFAYFSLRQYRLEDSEKYMAESISLTGDCSSKTDFLLMACIFLSRKKYLEALVFFNQLLNEEKNDVLVIMLLGLTYKYLKKSGLEKFYLAKAKRICMKHLGLVPGKSIRASSLENLNFRYEEGKGMTGEVLDDLYLMVAEYLVSEKLVDLARTVLESVTNKESVFGKFAYFTAEIEYWGKRFECASAALEDLLKVEPRHSQGWSLKGDCCLTSKSFSEAQDCYLKALRYSKASNSALFVKLGNIYLKNCAFVGAKLLFSKCCENEPSSISWQGLGIACLNLDELDMAEQALTQANLMNDDNAYTWAALAYLCLKKTISPPGRYFQFRQCLVQAFKLGIKDKDLLVNMAHEYVRKFFLEGTGPNSQRLDTSEIKIIYKKAKICGADSGELKADICKEFEKLKGLGNNKLDLGLIKSIENAKQEIIEAIN